MEFEKFEDKIEMYNSYQSITIGRDSDNKIYISSFYNSNNKEYLLTDEQLKCLIEFLSVRVVE